MAEVLEETGQQKEMFIYDGGSPLRGRTADGRYSFMIAEVLGGQQKELLIYNGRSPWTRTTKGRCSFTVSRSWAEQQKEDFHSLLADLGQNTRRKMFIHC